MEDVVGRSLDPFGIAWSGSIGLSAHDLVGLILLNVAAEVFAD